MAGEEVVIVDGKGVEHVFPAGFDPKKAAAIVSGQSSKPYTNNDPLVTHLGERAPGGYTTTEGQQPSKAMASLSALAHPKDVLSMLALALPAGAAVGAADAAAPAMKAAAPVIGKGAMKVGSAIEKAATGPFAERLSTIGAAGEALRGDFTKAAASFAIPKVLEYLGAGMRSLGELLVGTDSLTLKDINALRTRLVDPRLANNPTARQAIETAIRTRGGKV